MEEKLLIEEYFGKQLKEYIGGDKEKAKLLYMRLKSLSSLEEWRVFQKIIEDTRERVIQNFQTSPTQLEILIAYRELLSALDFLKNLPDNLMRVLEFEFEVQEAEI